jgi:Flp pilus assembly pilin Flp
LKTEKKQEEKPMLMRFLRDEQGQDLIEYTLLLAFVCLATAALFVSSGGSLTGIWTSANSQLGAANSSAS